MLLTKTKEWDSKITSRVEALEKSDHAARSAQTEVDMSKVKARIDPAINRTKVEQGRVQLLLQSQLEQVGIPTQCTHRVHTVPASTSIEITELR